MQSKKAALVFGYTVDACGILSVSLAKFTGL